MEKLKGNIVDVLANEIYPAEILFEAGIIKDIIKTDEKCSNYILPGLIDSHIHIESSMLIPSEFARIAVVHGTTATVSDPHEIANVLGKEGIKFMIENGKKVPFKFNFGVPSCVPATSFETSGAELKPEDIESIFAEEDLKYLSEMMNFPGVVYNDKEVMAKINAAKKFNKPIDGHAPGLTGEQLQKYVEAGISTDHEAYELEEAEEKIRLGMKILIREGSAAKNFEVLKPLLKKYPDMVMLCSDDLHPDDLIRGHINLLVKRALEYGIPLFDVLKAAIVNPVKHYGLDSGLLRKDDSADFIVVNNLNDFDVLRTYVKGILAAESGKSKIDYKETAAPNNFITELKSPDDFTVKAEKSNVRIIEAIDGQLITKSFAAKPLEIEGKYVSDTVNDILKIAVINRYTQTSGSKQKEIKPSVGFIKNFGIKKGAIASSVAHDSHNIIAIGTTDRDLCEAVNAVIKSKGGIAVSDGENIEILPLPIGGIMTNLDGFKTSEIYSNLDRKAKELGSNLTAPFMTLSFMALLVIPSIKISDKGLFDGNTFSFTGLEF